MPVHSTTPSVAAPPWAEPGAQPLCAPTFTIVTSCKDSAQTIEDCVNSVARQSFTSVEHVVVDRHSRDDSMERIYAQRERLSIVYGNAADSRFQAWNRGIGHAGGDVVGFLDARDALADPEVLMRVANVFEDPAVSAVYGDVLCVDQRDLRRVRRRRHLGPISPTRLARGWVPPTQAMFVRTSWYRGIDGFAPGMRFAADYAASLRLFSHPAFNAVYLGEPVVRQRPDQLAIGRLLDLLRAPRDQVQALRAAQLGGWYAWARHRVYTLEGWGSA